MKTLIKRLQEYWENYRSTITTVEQLQEMIRAQSAKICGELVLKYAYKRLGKVHFLLAKSTPAYSQDLINCQAQLHAEVIADIYLLLLHLCHYETGNDRLQLIMQQVHQDYIASVPNNYSSQTYLSEGHFKREPMKLGQLANNTGIALFKMLPAQSDLLPGNARIFQGQVRVAYIAFLEKLGDKIHAKQLQDLLS